MNRREKGARAEEVVAEYLERRGWTVLDRNVHFRVGELDLVADDGAQLVFVEVRSGRGGAVRPEDTVTRPKQRRLTHAAMLYLERYRGPRDSSRFDVIAVDDETWSVSAHHAAAFEATE